MPPLLILTAILWAAMLFGGLLVGRPAPDGSGRMPAWMRLGSSVTLAAAAWLWVSAGQGPKTPLLLIAAGMSLGLIGDLLMTLRPSNTCWHLPAALASFGLGHIAYCAALISVGSALGLGAGGFLAPLLLMLPIGAAGWYMAVHRACTPTAITWAALPYALLLSTTAGLAVAVALRSPALFPLAAGAGLFLVSDLILAARVFGGMACRNVQDLIWLTYGPAQAMLVYGLHLFSGS